MLTVRGYTIAIGPLNTDSEDYDEAHSALFGIERYQDFDGTGFDSDNSCYISVSAVSDWLRNAPTEFRDMMVDIYPEFSAPDDVNRPPARIRLLADLEIRMIAEAASCETPDVVNRWMLHLKRFEI